MVLNFYLLNSCKYVNLYLPIYIIFVANFNGEYLRIVNFSTFLVESSL